LKTSTNIKKLSKTPPDNFLTSQLTEHFQLSLILNNSDEFLLLIDRNYELIVYNSIVQRMVKERIDVDLKPGDDFFRMVEPEERERVKDFCDRAFNGEKVEFEYAVHMEKNNTLYFHNIYKPAVNNEGAIIAVIIISKDITEKKKSFAAILQSEQRWRFALEGSNQGVWDWNIETGEV
jgi:PAS domain-containing protein